MLCILILTVSLVNPKEVNAKEKNSDLPELFLIETDGMYATVQIEQTENLIITAEVKKDKVQSFIADFRSGIIHIPTEMVANTKLTRGNISPMAWIPPSNAKLNSEQRLYRIDIENTVKRISGTAAWLGIISNPISDATVTAILIAVSKSTVIGFLGTVMTWIGVDLINRQETWWKDSLIQILTGQIRYVRQAVYENTGTGYPIAWRICERIK